MQWYIEYRFFVWVYDQACSQDGGILAKYIILASLYIETSRSANVQETLSDEAHIQPAILTEQT